MANLVNDIEYSPFERPESGRRGRFLSAISLSSFLILGSAYMVCNEQDKERQYFLNKEIVTLEGTVVDERYVPPVISSLNATCSRYFFSISDSDKKKAVVEVINPYEQPPRLRLESVDALLREGTEVKVKARQISDGQYRAFTQDVYAE